jgi:Spy/CpxP family protein refolding chaperone
MKKLWMLGVALVLLPRPALRAQQPGDTMEAGRLRAQIEQRFRERVQQDLNLTPDQSAKLQATEERYGAQRRDVMQQQQERRRALDQQMQPGIQANSDSVRKLMDGIRNGRAQLVKIDQQQDQEMSGYLNPVQRARYQQMRDRFLQRVNELRAERREQRGLAPRPMRPGRGRMGRRRP